MTEPSPQHSSQPLTPARVREGVLTMTVALPAGQDEVFEWLAEPERQRRWSPVVASRPMTSTGECTSTESEGQPSVDATVTDVRIPWCLEHRWGDDVLTWQLAPSGTGTQLNLVHELADATQAPSTAAGWHLCLVVLTRLLAGDEVPRCVGVDAEAAGWQGLRERYQQLFDGEAVTPPATR